MASRHRRHPTLDQGRKRLRRTLLASRSSLEERVKGFERAAAPFAAVHDDYVEYFGDCQNDEDRMLGRIPRDGKPLAPHTTWADLRALAAFVNKKERT